MAAAQAVASWAAAACAVVDTRARAAMTVVAKAAAAAGDKTAGRMSKGTEAAATAVVAAAMATRTVSVLEAPHGATVSPHVSATPMNHPGPADTRMQKHHREICTLTACSAAPIANGRDPVTDGGPCRSSVAPQHCCSTPCV